MAEQATTNADTMNDADNKATATTTTQFVGTSSVGRKLNVMDKLTRRDSDAVDITIGSFATTGCQQEEVWVMRVQD